MEFTNEEMVKSLTSLIDETLEEIEEIKKSKFAASEISLGDSESGMAGKSKNGSLEAKKKEDEEDEEEDDKDEDKDEADMDKGENEKALGKKEDKDEDKKKKKDDGDADKDDKDDMKDLKKSVQDSQSLMKSYVDQKMNSLEEKLSKMTAAIESLANAPVSRKSVPAGISALHKSADEVEPLSKADLANKLFELKKSGKEVDSSDIFRVETGNQSTAIEIANKYGLR